MTKSSRSPRESLTTLACLGLVAAVLSGCQAQQPTRSDTQATTVAVAADTPREDAKAMEQAAFQAMTGRWAGKWDYGETSTLTVGGEGPEAMTVEYCYADECRNVT